MAGTDQLSVVFSALADPTRRAILADLSERDATVTAHRSTSHLEAAPLRDAPSEQGLREAFTKLDAT